MPTASEGAPPVRLNSVCSPTWRAISAIWGAVTGNPQAEIVAAAFSAVAPTTPAGLFTAK